jgi:hypothetical protein
MEERGIIPKDQVTWGEGGVGHEVTPLALEIRQKEESLREQISTSDSELLLWRAGCWGP